MRKSLIGVVPLVAALFAIGGAVPAQAGAARHGADEVTWLARQVAHQPLAASDGWAASGIGTAGGSAADEAHTFVVRDRAALAAALLGSDPKIVYVAGEIDGFTSAAGAPLTCADLADPAYNLTDYLAAYDPAVWGRATDPSGPIEQARVRSVAAQRALMELKVGSNTTIVGLRGAKLRHITLMIDGATSVIVRNLTFTDAADCFPRWRPTDGAEGNWNSEYDLVSVRRSTNVWVDHNTFSDEGNPDSTQPVYFGRPWQVHDGALDITHTSDLVTVSANVFTNHDKTMLIGSSDTVGPDVGKLRVTLRHNVFDEVGQRAPRVRFGQVDVYNNYFRVGGPTYDYSVGIGIQSAVYLENNYVALNDGITADKVLKDWKGTRLTELGTWVRPESGRPAAVSLLAAYNATHDLDFGGDAGWTPALRAYPPLPALTVPVVTLLSGAGRLIPAW
ncbi:pectate lyase [Allocatelliglobosispora scoriae]|uniref:Pectate lyase n=1 Tax=Allocatelliglobosispora scoriae TaxID=643052 RepID=A0A841BU60_9ACTN|nr:polysaccharide lyase family 1 protein [Allocatelliglobosispora scoriae]MBB5870301.1 pectate lyase [Allocatelliglobosispora scoriae]